MSNLIGLGLMSGTSADGIDAALVDFAHTPPRLLSHHWQPYSNTLRESLIALNTPGTNEIHEAARSSRQVAEAYGDLVATVLAETELPDPDFLACHGQTIRHNPDGPEGYTLQIGTFACLAECHGITTLSDFRSRDLCLGGQGAPLVPPFHRALFQDRDQPRVIINIGGIANVTFLSANAMPLTAFDTGPGNMLMDLLANDFTEGKAAYDKDGSIAACGTVHIPTLENWLAHPYFRQPPPKSTGREQFGAAYFEQLQQQASSLPIEDFMATLNALTATTIANAITDHFPEPNPEILVFGGGTHNQVLLHNLQAKLPNAQVQAGEAISGIPSQALEAMAFAWMGQQTLHGQPASEKTVTGARANGILGAIYPGRNWPQLLQKIF